MPPPAAHFSTTQSLWMVAAGLSFALMAQCAKVALDDMGVPELTFYRSAGGLVLLCPLVFLRGSDLRLRNYATHFWRAAWGMTALMLFYLAIHLLPTAVAYSLSFTSPLFFIVLVSVLLHERLPPSLLAALAGSCTGLLFLLRPDFTASELSGVLAGIASGFCAGMAFLMIRRLGHQGDTSVRTVFFLNVHGIAMAGGLALLLGEFTGIGGTNLWPVLGVVVFATTGQLALTQALTRGTSVVGAVLNYSGVVFSVLIDAGIHDIDFRPADYVGFTLIAGCGATALWLARTKAKLAVPG